MTPCARCNAAAGCLSARSVVASDGTRRHRPSLAPTQGLLKGKLDQRKRCLEVHWAAARDMKPGQLARMQATLAQWYVARKLLCIVAQRSSFAC